MLNLLDNALEAFLRTAVPLGRDVAVSFDAPDREWVLKISGRPTVNLFLWDVRRNMNQREGGEEFTVDADGRRHRRPALPRIDCRYLITAFTSDVRDEHSLLGQVMTALLLRSEIAASQLPELLSGLRPLPSVQIAAADGRDNADFWSALGGQLKAGLDVLVTATVDAAALALAGPDVHRYIVRTRFQPGSKEGGEREFVAGRTDREPGGHVTTRRGAARVTNERTFLVPGRAGDSLSVDGGTGVVPAVGPVEWIS